ncbi:Alpha-glucan water dikinase, chloroplastic [Linum perenne]
MGSNSETEKREDHTTNLYLFICMKISLKLLLIPNDEGLANTVVFQYIWRKSVRARRSKRSTGADHPVTVSPAAVLAMEPPSENCRINDDTELQAGSSSYLKLEIEDPKLQAIEFLIFDETRNKCLIVMRYSFLASAGFSVFQDEYEAGRDELLEEVARGSSIDDLRVKLTSKNDTSEIKELPESHTKKNTRTNVSEQSKKEKLCQCYRRTS